MTYADDITITSTSTSAAKNYIQPHLQKVFAWTKQNYLILNPDKTKLSLTKSRQNNLHSVHARPCRIYEQSGPQNTQHCTTIPMATHPKVLGLTLNPKLTYSTHIQNISIQAHKPLHMIKALTSMYCITIIIYVYRL